MNTHPGEVIALPQPEATQEQLQTLSAVIEAVRTEATVTRHLEGGIRVEGVEDNRLELVGGDERIIFAREQAGEPWVMERRVQAPMLLPNLDIVEVTVTNRSLVSGKHGVTWRQQYARHSGVYYAVGDRYGRDVLDPLTGNVCVAMAEQLQTCIPAARRTGRMAAAIALYGPQQAAA